MSLEIVSIVGMGGLGKTTLAKKVYGSSSVKSSFIVFSFCYVSQDPNTRRLLLDILGDVKGVDSRINDMTDDDLAHQLRKCLSGQKYLIILDDIWTESAWNKVRSSFPDDKNGSRVVFTTRSHEVADKCKISCSPHQLRFLSAVESWELLQKKVFNDGISPPYLCEIGKLIAKNCKGLPLAVGVIAGLLASTEKNLRWWSEVAERVVSYVSEEGCFKILDLSYQHLPVNLIPCFLYLGAFPEDMVVKVKNVILLWIAEGFIQESKTKDIEDVGKEYIHNLVDRNLIIVNARSSTGEMREFRVHDLIRDLCQTKCLDGKFLQMNHGIASSSYSNPSINHYRVSTQKVSDVTIATSGSSLSNARSLLYFSKQCANRVSELPLSKFRLAQVLNLESEWRGYDVKQLSTLVHLRHIDASLTLNSRYIPSSISNLWNISSITLTVIKNNIHLPETFWRMKSLRHVKIDQCVFNFSDCYEHETYPKLDNVVSFGKPIISSGRDVHRLLQRLPAVRKLSCFMERGLSDFDESVETLDFHGELESLKLTITQLGLFTCNRYLINFPSTLKKITLNKFELPWTAISAIAELQCLQVLKLRWISFPEPRLDMEDLTFQNLKFFELLNDKLVEWNASAESFPWIEQLVIQCYELKELPSCFGEISTLKRIVTRFSRGVEDSTLTIQEEQRALGNDVEVLIKNA